MDYFEITQKAIDWLEVHWDERVQVSDPAGVAYCSEAHFSRIFRAVVGCSVMEYVRGRKLSFAARDLVLTREKVLDIALRYGYETPQAFTKAFKQFHGISPMVCRKFGSGTYKARAFPLVAKMKFMKGTVDMKNFGSPLPQLLDDLGKEAANLYFCFHIGSKRYALVARTVWTIYPPWEVHINQEGQLFQHLWGRNHPVLGIEERKGLSQMAEGKQNILQCRPADIPQVGGAATFGPGVFGLIIDGNPEIKVAKSVKPFKDAIRPYVTRIGEFDDEETPILCTDALWKTFGSELATTFEKAAETPEVEGMEQTNPLQKLEHAAFKAEILARNASIEAANGGAVHRGTMVVAHELHGLAMEIAGIAQEMRG